MVRFTTRKISKFKVNKINKKYIKLILNIDKIIKGRESFINHHIPMLNQRYKKKQESIENRLNTIFEKHNLLPPICLASSLGFSKNSWNKNVECFVKGLDLDRRVKFPTIRNVILFEKFKYLALKFIEKERKRGY